MRQSIHRYLSVITMTLIAAFPSVVRANDGVPEIKLKSYLTVESFKELLTSAIPNFLILLIGLVSLVFILISGFRYLTSAGNQESTAEAKQGLLFAIIGLVITLGAYGILQTVRTLLGI